MSLQTFPLGRHVQHDERSRSFPAPSAEPVRTKIWTHYGAVLDQGQVGSCTGNAATQALMTRPLRLKGRSLTEDTAVSLYSTATRLDSIPGYYDPKDPANSEDTGSTGLAVAKAAQQAGLISGYTHGFGFDHSLSGLMTGPAIVGTNWHESMFKPDSKGYVHPDGNVVGGHEYLWVGVDIEKQRAAFLQSWGDRWGKHGRFYMSFEDFRPLLGDQGDVVFFH